MFDPWCCLAVSVSVKKTALCQHCDVKWSVLSITNNTKKQWNSHFCSAFHNDTRVQAFPRDSQLSQLKWMFDGSTFFKNLKNLCRDNPSTRGTGSSPRVSKHPSSLKGLGARLNPSSDLPVEIWQVKREFLSNTSRNNTFFILSFGWYGRETHQPLARIYQNLAGGRAPLRRFLEWLFLQFIP